MNSRYNLRKIPTLTSNQKSVAKKTTSNGTNMEPGSSMATGSAPRPNAIPIIPPLNLDITNPSTNSVENVLPSTELNNPEHLEEQLVGNDFANNSLNNTIISPEFHSNTAHSIRNEYRSENVPTFRLGNEDYSVHVQNYVESALGLAQVTMMREMENRLQGLITTIVKESVSNALRNATTVEGSPSSRPESLAINNPNTPGRSIHQQARQSNISQQGEFPTNVQNISQLLNPQGTQENPRQSFQNLDQMAYIRIDKWGLKFEGTPKGMSVEDFVFRVETLRREYNCSWNLLTRNFHMLLGGNALEWFWLNKRINNFETWPDLKESLISQFQRYESDFDIQRKILDRRQGLNESFDDFYNAVLEMRNQQRNPLSETDLVEIMKGNLKTSMAQLVFSIRIFGFAHFQKECKRAERLLANQRTPNYQYNRPYQRVNELDFDPNNPEYVDCDAIGVSRNVCCYNCNQMGHYSDKCPEPRRYKNVAGNQRPNTLTTGQTRSTQTETSQPTNVPKP